MTTDALLLAYQRGYPKEIEAAETAYQDERLAVYGDRRAVHHAEPAGYEQAFTRVMEEMREIEASAKANPLPPAMIVEGDFVYLRQDFNYGVPVDVFAAFTATIPHRRMSNNGDAREAPVVPGYRVFMALAPVTP